MSTRNAPNIILHWIPSHISVTDKNKRYYINGNEIADQLAKNAATSNTNPLDAKLEYVDIPRRITHTSAELVSAIDKLARRASEYFDSNTVGPSTDDLSYADATQPTSTVCSTRLATSSDV